MAFIAREDGEHFVIPSYRETLSGKQKSLLKKDILLLSQSYGEYITLHRKNAVQYEVAFSPDTGYLLGESVWHHFKKPDDLIYCEAIPGTTEAILVIVKSGSVYLDGSVPIESIPDELIVFLTQESHFDIYTFGEVPIAKEATPGKFNFEPHLVQSFTELDKPVFAILPLVKQYQLKLVDVVLKAHGIGVFPAKQLIGIGVVLGLLWMGWNYLTSKPQVIPQVQVRQAPNPLQPFMLTLSSPAPDQELKKAVSVIELLFTMPGWSIKTVDYKNDVLSVAVLSGGAKTETLFKWVDQMGGTVTVQQSGLVVNFNLNVPNRAVPADIYPIKKVIGALIDRIANVYRGNNLQLGDLANKGAYTDVLITMTLTEVTPMTLSLMADQLKDLPLVLSGMSISNKDGVFSGTITIDALGN